MGPKRPRDTKRQQADAPAVRREAASGVVEPEAGIDEVKVGVIALIAVGSERLGVGGGIGLQHGLVAQMRVIRRRLQIGIGWHIRRTFIFRLKLQTLKLTCQKNVERAAFEMPDALDGDVLKPRLRVPAQHEPT